MLYVKSNSSGSKGKAIWKALKLCPKNQLGPLVMDAHKNKCTDKAKNKIVHDATYKSVKIKNKK